jgi:CheY-like chemotaxis protein
VDDEASLIESMKRQLRNDFDITAAHSGDEGLKTISANAPFSVIVSDQRMPGMDGIEFLSLVKDLSPDSIRIMLTGYADQDTAIDAVNQGSIFRFLTKPCPPHVVLRTLRDAYRQYELVTAEKELLEQTLTGSLAVMMDILALANPVVFQRASRVGEYVDGIVKAVSIPNVWQVRTAAALSHMGYITLPTTVLENYYSGHRLGPNEEAMMQGQVENTANLLDKIPRMAPVVRIIHESSTSRNTPAVRAHDPVAFGANILHTASELDRRLMHGMSRQEILRGMALHPEEFNEEIVKAIASVKLAESASGNRRVVMIDQLANGMIVDEDVRTKDGMLIVPKGYVVNDTARRRLRNFRLHDDIEDTIAVLSDTNTHGAMPG